MDYTQAEVSALLSKNCPIAICDGNKILIDSSFEIYVSSWLHAHAIKFEREQTLYFRNDFDLSKYRTIIFDTNGGGLSDMKNTFEDIVTSFSKENLKIIIVGSDLAYLKVKDLAEKLGILVIGCDIWDAWCEVEKQKEDYRNEVIDEYPDIHSIWKKDFLDLFFDPKEKWLP